MQRLDTHRQPHRRRNQLCAAVVALWVGLLPLLVSAQGGLSYRVTDFTGFADAENPLQALVLAILEIIIVLAIPIIVLFIIYAGFLYVTARGNSQQIEQATRAFTYAVIGAVLVIGAVALAGIIEGIVGSLRA